MIKQVFFCCLLCFVGKLIFAAEDSPVQTVFRPFQEATIAARVDSVLLHCRFKLGENFKKDDILLELDSEKYAILSARMSAKKEFAENDLKDKKELQKKRVSSEWEQKKAEFDYKLAKADYDEALLNHSYCLIRAPFDGKIAELMTHEHETVRNGQPLCRIIADHQLLAVMNVSIQKRVLLVPGNKVTIRLNDSRLVKGTIYEVSPISDNRTETVRIRVLIPNAKGEYFAGLTGVLQDVER